jgi:hypothetical protein
MAAAPPQPLHPSVALDGAGWHPAAWREPRARPAELLTARYWVDVITEAERGLLDFVTIEDGLSLQSNRHGEADVRSDRVRGRLDAVLIAARVAPEAVHPSPAAVTETGHGASDSVANCAAASPTAHHRPYGSTPL